MKLNTMLKASSFLTAASVAATLLLSVSLPLQAADANANTMAAAKAELKADSLQSLLNEIKQNRVSESTENKQREAEFKSNLNRQKALLAKARAELKTEKKRGDRLSKVFDKNDKAITKLTETLRVRSGTLGEMVGVVRQFSADNLGIFKASSITAQYPERTAFMADIGDNKELPTIERLERLWLEIHQEMTESGRIVTFPSTVIFGNGDEAVNDVIRVGSFNNIAAGKFLNYLPETGKFAELTRQPDGRVLDSAEALQEATSGVVPFYLDPSRGVILSLLVQSPSLGERIDQGGSVGYVILAMGVFGLLLAAFCLYRLTLMGNGMRQQLNSTDIIEGNPLGEIMAVYQKNKGSDVETLELQLDEVIVRNLPKIERGVPLIKLIAAVAPLLGLLGTVVGMIATFQAITLFGTGDPKLMAGGISEALVTTMLGLVVAVPTLFAHSLVNGRAKSLIHILEEQSTGFIARQKEQLDAKQSDATTSQVAS